MLSEEMRKEVGQLLSAMVDEVEVDVCGGDEKVRELFRELEELSNGKLRVNFNPVRCRGVVHKPTIIVRAFPNIAFVGVPVGYEFANFLLLVMIASRGLKENKATEMIRGANIDGERSVYVFVTPECNYCPEQVRNLMLISAIWGNVVLLIYDVTQFPELVEKLDIRSVPLTVVKKGNDVVSFVGVAPLPVTLSVVRGVAVRKTDNKASQRE